MGQAGILSHRGSAYKQNTFWLILKASLGFPDLPRKANHNFVLLLLYIIIYFSLYIFCYMAIQGGICVGIVRNFLCDKDIQQMWELC